MPITGDTLRSTIKQGARLLIAQRRQGDERPRRVLAQHLENASTGIDLDVVMSDEAWR